MSISYKGYNSGTITCEAGEGLAVGYPVKINDSDKAVPAGNGDTFIGICTAVRGDWASVQVSGYAEIPYSGNISILSHLALVADASHKVKEAGVSDVQTYYKTLKLDSAKRVIGIIL